jgi:hypothetical protein
LNKIEKKLRFPFFPHKNLPWLEVETQSLVQVSSYGKYDNTFLETIAHTADSSFTKNLAKGVLLVKIFKLNEKSFRLVQKKRGAKINLLSSLLCWNI